MSKRLPVAIWLLKKSWQLLKVAYFGFEFLAVLAFTIICYTLMLPFMLLIFAVRLLVKPFTKKKHERVNIQPIKPRT